MKRWALLTVFLYAAAVSALVAPILFLLPASNDRGEFFGAFFGIFLPVLVAIQGALLLVPVSVARERPVKRRTALTSALVGAFPMAVLLGCFIWFILIMLLGEDGAFEEPLAWGILGVFIIGWIFWGGLFYRGFSPQNPGSLTSTMTGWLLKGSILEILVAIPSHIISRNRNECCAPGLTLLGLVTGLSVALMAFGPGLYFLFARKVREKKRASPATSASSSA